MRLAHFVQRYPPALGGSESYFARLSRYLAAAGDRVSVFTTNALDLTAFWSSRGCCGSSGTTHEEGVEVHRYPLVRWPGRRFSLKALSFIPNRFWQSLTLPCNPISWRMWSEAGSPRQSFDAVHATAFPYCWPIACGLRLARRLRVPFLLTPFLHLGNHDDPGDRTRRAYLAPPLLSLVRAAQHVFVQTCTERAALIDQGIPEGKLCLLGMGVDPAECTGGDRERIRSQWAVRPDEVVIGHLANNSIEKGTVDLLRAAEQLWQRGIEFRLVLAGPVMPNFERFWLRYPLAQRVIRVGVLSEAHKRDFFAGIDLFALPSRSDSFGLVLLEAWANGVPSVAYRAGGVADVIQHGKDGLLAPCDVGALAAALGQLVKDEGLRRRLGASGCERTRGEFRWEDKLERVRQVYCELIGNRRLQLGGDARQAASC